MRKLLAILIGAMMLAGDAWAVDIALTGSNKTDVTLSWEGTPGLGYFVSTSFDLQHWTPFWTNVPDYASVRITDYGSAASKAKFYKIGSTPYVNGTEAENQLLGNSDWQLTNPVTVADREWPTLRTRAIEGFASATSVNKGEWITFYISTTSPTYMLEIYRMGYYAGFGARLMPNCSWTNLAGIDQPTPPTQDNGLIECDWQPAYLTRSTNGSLQIPSNWVSGVYVAKLTASSGKQSYLIFVVRDDARCSPYLVQSSVTTYQAYNQWGGKSTYFGVNEDGANAVTNLLDISLSAGAVSFDRPYMAGSDPNAAYGSGAGHFFTWEKVQWPLAEGIDGAPQGPATWEYNMVRWLESSGYDVTYCTDIDVHSNPNLLLTHKAFISVGHDEYWSSSARLNVQNARDAGINAAFFSGNVCWNMIRLDPDSKGNAYRTQVYNRNYPGGVDTNVPPTWGNFHNLGWYEESFVGGTWPGLANEGGEGDSNLEVPNGCPAWLTEGTGLNVIGVLGTNLAGYEVNGWVTESDYSSSQEVPPGTQIVFSDMFGNSGADSIFYTSQVSGATVFSAATVQWSWGLDDFTVTRVPPIIPLRSVRLSDEVRQVTRNVLSRFLDATRMVADLPDGNYIIQSVSAYPQSLMASGVSDPALGAPNSTVMIASVQTNKQGVWIVKRYDGNRPPSIGPYKAADDVWYTIRDAQTGEDLIVSDNGQPGGPVITLGDANGYWGQPPDNLQQMWRIWRYTGNNGQWHLLQNVASGQLFIVTNNGVPNSPVVVYGDNGGWGETEENPEKMWIFTPQ
jgi:hypothetical protein